MQKTKHYINYKMILLPVLEKVFIYQKLGSMADSTGAGLNLVACVKVFALK